MAEETGRQDDSWPVGWKAHELAQLRRLAKLPLWKKLLWLQEMNRIARHMRQASLRRSEKQSSSTDAAPLA